MSDVIKRARLRHNTSTQEILHPETEWAQLVDGNESVDKRVKTFYVPVVGDYFYRPKLLGVSKTTITVWAGTRFVVNGRYYEVTEDTSVALPSGTINGKDVYLYACENPDATSTTPVFVTSLNSTYPNGYTAATSRKIGGVHCLCVAVGTISGHPLSGYAAGNILPASVWDLAFRAVAGNEGMVYCEALDLWVDIYLASVSGSGLASIYNATTADGGNSHAWWNFVEKFSVVKKRLPWQHEFAIFALGSNQGTNVQGSNDKGTAGGYVDKDGRRMISNIGCESCCGFLWQWANDTGDHCRYNNESDKPETLAAARTWKSTTVSGESDSKGQSYQDPGRAILGGAWVSGACCGSRSSSWAYGSLDLHGSRGARGVCAVRRGAGGSPAD